MTMVISDARGKVAREVIWVDPEAAWQSAGVILRKGLEKHGLTYVVA